jgi:hypothetical protein
MPAHRDESACTGAVVRKPPVKERALGWVLRCRALWRFDRAGVGVRKSAGFGDDVIVPCVYRKPIRVDGVMESPKLAE